MGNSQSKDNSCSSALYISGIMLVILAISIIPVLLPMLIGAPLLWPLYMIFLVIWTIIFLIWAGVGGC